MSLFYIFKGQREGAEGEFMYAQTDGHDHIQRPHSASKDQNPTKEKKPKLPPPFRLRKKNFSFIFIRWNFD